MFKKKFVTVGCVLGILAFGACFGPPPHPPTPGTAPPLRDSFHGIRSMAVEVENRVASPHLNPDDFAKAVAWDINIRRGESHIVASVGADSNPQAQLRVSILDEKATHPPGSPNWSVSADVSGSVIARNGRVLWGDRGVYSIVLQTPETDADQVWQDPVVRNRLARVLVTRMLHWE